MSSPLKPLEGNWWTIPVSRFEKIWVWISVVWGLVLFGWMVGWSFFGAQNQHGPTYRIEPAVYRAKLIAYREASVATEAGMRPAGDDVYIAAMRYGFDGLPVILKAGKTYRLHLTSYDVQHGFSIRPEHALSKQLTLQLLPGYEWVLPMRFEEAGVYHVICNEFCGIGHRTMHGIFIVEE